jgi:hypothetical protein
MTTPALTSLNCRLLCACECAYGINAATGLYTPNPTFSPGVNFIGTPTPFSADQVNAALVGQNADGIIVAFRGTLPPALNSALSLHDWLEDFFDVPKTVATGPGQVPGQVHSGFYDAVMGIINAIAAQVKALDATSTIPVYVTGHSKGGAMASIGAYILSQNVGMPVKQVITFASPKAGDSGFRAGYQAVIPNQVRFENYGDLVPLLPPSNTPVDLLTAMLGRIPGVGKDIAGWFNEAKNWDYQAVGTLAFIESSSNHYQINSTELIESQVLAVFEEVGRDLLAFNFNSIADAHTLACGYGYSHGVCPTGVCDQT